MKEYLAPFFGNNFFQNLLSPYTVEENLLYVISLLLKNEIDKLSSENDLDKFLNNSRCGYLLNNSYIALNLDIYYLENVME